ncbi:uncharacterized protein [Hetaerina americana]|uniref:uncharacterized protein isoform X2 n=1 Tax=Hetaerina americana TaxID=62018 RepID=UPI003A7F33D2
MAWTREAASLLIDMYFHRPSLYKTNSPDYYDRNKRQKCLAEIATGLLEVRGPTTEDEVRVKINGLRTQYQSEVNKMEASRKASGGPIYQPKLWCFNQLQFLRDHITPRKSSAHSNYKDEADAEIESSEHNSYHPGIQQREESQDSATCRHIEMEDYSVAEEEDINCFTVKRQRAVFDRRDFDNSYHIGQSNVTSNSQRGYEDKYDIFGKYLASELRDITNDSLFLHAKKEILAILMEYQLKQLEFNKMGL